MRRDRPSRWSAARPAVLSVALSALALGRPSPARAADATLAEPPDLMAEGACEPMAGSGRLRCDVTVRPAAGLTLRWADAQVLGAPAWIAVLRGRLGPDDAIERSEAQWRLRFSLVAKGRGEGTLQVRARGVVCKEGSGCRAAMASVVVPLARS